MTADSVHPFEQFASPLVTWNVFFSASAFERQEVQSWESIEDLVLLIDLLCLRDRIVVLGDPDRPPFHLHHSRFFDALRESGAIKVRSLPDDQLAVASETAQKHAVVFLGAEHLTQVEDWLSEAFAVNHFHKQLLRPTMNLTVRTRTPLELRRISPEGIARILAHSGSWNERTYVSRTFMYYAAAEALGLHLNADAARRPLLGSVVKHEQRWIEQAADKATSQWRKFPKTRQAVRKHLSPLTAALLERSHGNQARFSSELLKLREELSPLRTRLNRLESEVISGKRNRALTLERRWSATLKEIERSYGLSPGLITVRSGLGLAEDASALGDTPKDWSEWAKVLGGLPLTAILRLMARRPVIELIKLRRELWSSGRIAERLQQLYPRLEPPRD